MSPNELNPMADDAALEFLRTAEIDIEGRMPWSSNATFLVNLQLEGQVHQGIYKPVRGERPLWDFEPGLHRRECAAYHLSRALGLLVVPPTVIREGPFGEGSLQWFVNADHSQHYFTIFEHREDLHDQLRTIALFDVLANNTDRKSGHCLIAEDMSGVLTTACVLRPNSNYERSSGSSPEKRSRPKCSTSWKPCSHHHPPR